MYFGEQRITAAPVVSVVRLAIATLGMMLAIGNQARLHGAEEATRQIAVDDAHLGLAPYVWKCSVQARRLVPKRPCPGHT